MADKYWPHQDPLGKRFTLKTSSAAAKTLQIVGVAGNGKYVFIAEDPTAFFYVSAGSKLHTPSGRCKCALG